MNEATLKQKLLKIKNNNYVSDDNEYLKLLPIMIDNIGNTDYVLRDNLIYSSLFYWIYRGYLSNDVILNILDTITDEKHLFFNIDKKDNTAIYTRSFSSLYISAILYKHNQEKFLSSSRILELVEIMSKYLESEHDLRGYDYEYGWAHSVAHSSDVFAQLACCDELESEQLLNILYVFKTKISQGFYVYIDGEFDRMNSAVQIIIERDIVSLEAILKWLDEIVIISNNQDHITAYHQKVNVINYLRSLYFACLHHKLILDKIISLLENM